MAKSIIGPKNSYSQLYRGITPNLAGNTCAWALYFWGYQFIKDEMKRQDPNVPLSTTQHLLASAVAGASIQLVTNPIWVIKTRMFATSPGDPNAFRGLVHGLSWTWKHEGLRGLYKGRCVLNHCNTDPSYVTFSTLYRVVDLLTLGLVPGLFGVSHGAIQFAVYEEMKQYASLMSHDTVRQTQ